MFKENDHKTDKESFEMLKYLFEDAQDLYKVLAPKGWGKSEYVHFLHPTPKQQYEEHKTMTDNLNRLKRIKSDDKTEEEYNDISEFEQDDLKDINEYGEFLYVLGLAVYDIFSNNHEVVDAENKVYHLGSMRGSGTFIANFFNTNFDNPLRSYDYMDFYMGTIWIRPRGDLLSFYEFVFQKLKAKNCDWIYSFPRMHLIDPKKLFNPNENKTHGNYKPENSAKKELELSEIDKEVQKFRDELDKIYEEEFEEAKYKPLTPIVQAYKNVYAVLPKGHPQKEFE